MRSLQWRGLILCLVLMIVMLPSESLLAGPPYLNSDPVPAPYREVDVYLYSYTSKLSQFLTAQVPAIEVQYGVSPDLEFNATIPLATTVSLNHAYPGGVGLGDMQIGMTYRFIHETSYFPQVGIAPIYFIPTGDVNRNLGNGQYWIMLPLLAQKSWGPWTAYGGPGYAYNGASYAKNFVFGGMVLQRDINSKLTVGGEFYYQGASSRYLSASTIINFGFNYNISKTFAVLGSAGHSVSGASNFVTYIGLNWSLS